MWCCSKAIKWQVCHLLSSWEILEDDHQATVLHHSWSWWVGLLWIHTLGDGWPGQCTPPQSYMSMVKTVRQAAMISAWLEEYSGNIEIDENKQTWKLIKTVIHTLTECSQATCLPFGASMVIDRQYVATCKFWQLGCCPTPQYCLRVINHNKCIVFK